MSDSLPAPTEGQMPEDPPMDILSYTRNLRLKMVNHLTSGGTNMPTAAEDVYPLLSTLKDLDSQELNLRKLKQDDRNADSDRRVSIAIAEFAARQQGNPFEHITPLPARDIVVEDVLLGDYVAVPGETEQGTVTENLQDFMSKREGQ